MVLAFEKLQNEVSFIAKPSMGESRQYLNYLEVEHLIKITSIVVKKIKNHTKGDLQ